MVSQGFSERLHFRKGCFALVIVTAAFDNTGIFHAEEPSKMQCSRSSVFTPVTGSLFFPLELCFFLYRHPDCTMIVRVCHFSVYTVIPLYCSVSAELIIWISG